MLSPAQDATEALRAAQRAEAAGDTLNAFFLYGRAARLNPSDSVAAMQAQQLGDRLLRTATVTQGLDPASDPEVRMANRILVEGIAPSEAIEGRDAVPVARLNPSTERKDFDLRGTARPVIEEVASAFGIQTVFDPDYESAGPITFRVTEMSRNEAFRALETATSSFFVPLRGNLIQVFRDTQDKRTGFLPVVAAMVPIPERMNVQEAQELATGINTIFEMRRMAVDAGRRVIFMRDQEYKVVAARRLISELMRLRAQVSFDVELLSVAKNSTLDYGFNLPNMAAIVNLKGSTSIAQLGGIASSWFGLAVAEAQAFATMSRSSTEASLRANLVALDGQQVQLQVGDRYPVVSGVSGVGATAVPISQYQDLGLTLQITPVVQDGDLTLTLDATYSLLTGGTNNNIPIIAQRKFQGTTSVRFDQWAIVAGLATMEETNTKHGFAGLATIPIFGHLFRRDIVTKTEGRILVLIKPRLMSEPGWEHPTEAFWMGTETRPPTFY